MKAAANKPTKSILKKDPVVEDNGSKDDDEWSGFSDEEAQEQKEPKPTSKPKADNHQKNSTDSVNKKKTKKEAVTKKAEKEPNAKLPSLSFTALENEEEEDGVDVSAWDSLGLSTSLQTGLSKLKFSSPTTIQQATIPEVLAGHDVVGKASTGSGKTLAFGIPILEHYLSSRGQTDTKKDKKTFAPLALILSPTRELAHQLAKHIGELNTHTPAANARIALLTGGLSIQKQQRLLADADLIIGTPGRVWEMLSSGSGLIRGMSKIKFLVIDEADRLLSDGHFKEMGQIVDALDRKEYDDAPEENETDEDETIQERQTLVFSATFHKGLQQKLSGKGKFMNSNLLDKNESMEYLLQRLNFREERPKFVDVNPISQMAEGLKEGIVECGAMEKVCSRTHINFMDTI